MAKKKKIKISNRKKITVQSDFYPSRKTSTTALRPSDTWKHRAFRITGKLHFFYHNRIRRFYNEKSIKKKKMFNYGLIQNCARLCS